MPSGVKKSGIHGRTAGAATLDRALPRHRVQGVDGANLINAATPQGQRPGPIPALASGQGIPRLKDAQG
jgi:hypothetical protein